MSDPTVVTPIKPGWQSTEFWLTLLAQLLGAVMASGLLPGGEPTKVAGIAATMLAAYGYTSKRTAIKMAGAALLLLGLLLAAPARAEAPPAAATITIAAPASAPVGAPRLVQPAPLVEPPPAVALDPRLPLCVAAPAIAPSSTAATVMQWLAIGAAILGASAVFVDRVDAAVVGRAPALP